MRSGPTRQRDTVDFLQRGVAGLYQRQRGFAQAARTAARGGFLDLADGCAGDDQFAQFVGEQQDFGDGAPAPVAAAPAVAAAAPLAKAIVVHGRAREGGLFQQRVGRLGRRAAMRAIHAHQPLRDDTVQGRYEAVGIDAHMDEAADHVEHVVGVDRREYEVPGERGLHGDLRRVGVTDFPDHDLVRVVAQDGTQAARETQAFLLVDRNLQHAGELVFDRVLDGDDLVATGVDLGQCGIERGRLARAGGAGDEQHPVGLGGQLAYACQRRTRVAQAFEGEAGKRFRERLPVEDAQHRILAEYARHHRHTHIDLAALHGDLEAAILRHAALGDIEFGHHFNAGNRLFRGLAAGHLRDVREHPVDTVFDRETARVGFQMNVGCTRLQGIVECRAHQPYHRTRVFGDAGEGQGLGVRILRALRAVATHAFHRAQAFLVAGEQGSKIGRVREPDVEGGAEHVCGIGAAGAVPGVGQQQPEPAIGVPRREAVPSRGLAKTQAGEIRRQCVQRSHVKGRQAGVRVQCGQRGVGVQAELFLQPRQQRLACGACLAAQVRQGLGCEDGRGRVHWIDPASSKIGM